MCTDYIIDVERRVRKSVMDLLKSVAHPSELWALLKFRLGGGKEAVMPHLDYVRKL